jgi:succinate dehydrogenase / fumarate reductase, cytochrome b subunit
MSKFLTASIGRKFLMSITGLFLLVFIVVHLTVNILLIFDDSGDLFNQAAHFMATNPAVRLMEPLLGIGFLIHIIWSFIISWENWRARPVKYKKQDLSNASSWSSRNMLIIGFLVLIFLVIHIYDFYWKMKVTGSPLLDYVVINGVDMKNSYALVTARFIDDWIFSLLYIAGGVLLGLHVIHGFWSSFQTLGLNNKIWMARLQLLSRIYAIVVAVGFSVIPLYFLIKF